ncbi:extracellular solute-binding protein [Salinactinospora qingdaonensis]|uniref:Extracellular solute-binding protein n=1 Tax=Salinactinospora qingdaonensis TaxID=702744 RepID=A0ABP7G921_9ACTN
MEGKPGSGGEYTAMTPAWWAIPPGLGSNEYFQAVNEALGATIDFEVADGNTYADKLQAVLASDSIPDWVCIPGWNLPPRTSEVVANKFADLTDFLAGDKIAKYPNLANIPTDAWRYAVFNGKLSALPFPSELVGNPIYYRRDLFEKLGVEPPGSAQEFLELAKEITDPDNKRWACDDMWTTAQTIFHTPPDRPHYWKLVDGELVHKVETEEYIEALEWCRKLYEAGVVHPDAVAGKTADAKQRFESGETLIYNDGTGAWYEAVNRQAESNPEFDMQAMDFFAPDGGQPRIWAAAAASLYSFISKEKSTAEIEELLALADFIAAPFGTTEHLLINYGVEGVHHERNADGAPELTEKGSTEVTQTYSFLVTPPRVYAKVDHPQLVKDYCAWSARQAPHVEKPLFYGMQIQEPTRYATLFTPFEDLQKDVVRGRRSIADVRDAVENWRKQGGDELRGWYADLLEKTEENSGN